MSKVTTSSAATSATSASDQDARLAALEAAVAALAATLSKAAPAAPIAPAAPAAPAPAFRPLTEAQFQMLTPQQKAVYQAQCDSVMWGNKVNKNETFTGLYGTVTGFASNQLEMMQNATTHAKDVYSRTRSAYLMQRGLSQTKYDAHKVDGNTSLFCPKCGFSFRHHDSAGGKAVGGTGGAAAGAALGAKIGIAAGPLGAIAGTVPGAILGAVFGAQAGNHLDKPQCPRCGTSFSLSSSKPEKGFVEIFKETYTKEREKFKKARDPNDESYREAIKNLLQKRGDVNLKDYSISKFIFLTDAEMKQLNQEHQLKYRGQVSDIYFNRKK